jgi:hypothetical protein
MIFFGGIVIGIVIFLFSVSVARRIANNRRIKELKRITKMVNERNRGTYKRFP